MDQQNQQPEQKKKSRKWLWIIISIFGAIILLFIIAVATAPAPENVNNQAESTNIEQQVEDNTQQLTNDNSTADEVEEAASEESFTFQSPSEFAEGSAQRKLAQYVEAWKNKDWDAMASYTQLTWKDGKEDPASELDASYGLKNLKGFEITKTEQVSDVTTDITFTVQYEFIAGQISKKQIKARVIRETDAYTPSENGQWGVNPISTFSETDI